MISGKKIKSKNRRGFLGILLYLDRFECQGSGEGFGTYFDADPNGGDVNFYTLDLNAVTDHDGLFFINRQGQQELIGRV